MKLSAITYAGASLVPCPIIAPSSHLLLLRQLLHLDPQLRRVALRPATRGMGGLDGGAEAGVLVGGPGGGAVALVQDRRLRGRRGRVPKEGKESDK